MPSKSKQQQKLMGMAYAYATGEMEDAPKSIKSIAKSFLKAGKRRGLKRLRDFASTKHQGLPRKIESFSLFIESLES